MTVYAATGATGALGHLIVEGLLESGVRAADVVAVVRAPSGAADLAARGVQVREGDYDRPGTLAEAFAGVDVLMFVSGSEVGARVEQHRAVVAAARGVRRIVYTSIVRATTSELVLAPEHKATEELILASGLPYTLLRNSWYLENYTRQVPQYIAGGEIVGAADDGRISAAARADYAAAAVAVLVGEGHDNRVYELGGASFTLAELAAVVTEVTGTAVTYRDVPVAQLVAELEAAGLPAQTAGFVAALDEGIARGDLEVSEADLVGLIGRPPTALAEAVSAAKS
ncbi:MAG: hypothetical protein QOJ11_1092 [Frankiales bacterium]|jgi:NAD(P)H dehydrogenase (quinone)|nr:hypothetical protein [Frankiales bacterium]